MFNDIMVFIAHYSIIMRSTLSSGGYCGILDVLYVIVLNFTVRTVSLC